MTCRPVRSYEVVPARPMTALWVERVLGAPIRHCRFRDAPPPVEFSPLPPGLAGLARNSGTAPGDGRIHLSTRAIQFWSNDSVVGVYIHEASHRLCFSARVDEGHGPVFFAVLCTLAMRVDSSAASATQVLSLSMYDFGDRPSDLSGWPLHRWTSEVLGFALACASDLAASELHAEDLPGACAERWRAWVGGVLTADEEVTRLRAQLAAAQLAVLREKRNNRLRHWLGNRVVDAAERQPIGLLAVFAGLICFSPVVWQVAQLILRFRGQR